jgi:hypothetical protein
MDTYNGNVDYDNFISRYTGSPESKCLAYAQNYNNNPSNTNKITSFSIRKNHGTKDDTCRFNSSSASNWQGTTDTSIAYLNTYCVNGNAPNTNSPYCTTSLGLSKFGYYSNGIIFDNTSISGYNGSAESKCLAYAQNYNNNSANTNKIALFSIRKQHTNTTQNDTCLFNSSSASNWVDTPNSSPTTQYLNTYCVNGNNPNTNSPYCTI